VTNAPPVASALANHAIVEVVLVGRRLLKDAQVTVGAATVEALDDVRAEVCVLGVARFIPRPALRSSTATLPT
jgi:DeoR/GlpR family transcriptional regulator of sugar metabolism